ncbi:MAG TPA: SDR family NAD(P)-dependent oxidoreductase [Aggregatilineales bacterium]|nr:SDR family NAD(P)-dependent oxidoreductase [Aggregatilineales bacterium]
MVFPELNGKVAVISGAGGALGFVVAQRLHAEGCQLALAERKADVLRQRLAAQGIADALIGPVDLTRKDAVDPFIDRVAAHFGQIDILVNVAGGYKAGQPVHEMDEAVWDSMLDINARTTFLMSAAAARQMVAKGNPGRIINVGSRAALKGDANSAAYSASKAIVLRLTESMSAELLPHGITVNAVLPSTIDTPTNRSDMPRADFSKWITPESLAGVIAFLASDGAKDISGAAIPVYGRA